MNREEAKETVINLYHQIAEGGRHTDGISFCQSVCRDYQKALGITFAQLDKLMGEVNG